MLADLQLNTKRDQVLLKLKNGPVWVYGPTGSGRSSLMVELKKALDVVDVEPPGLGDVDAPIHALAQCAAGGAGTATIVFEKQSLYERARRLAMELSSAKKTLVVRAPASWTFGAGSESADDLRRKQDALQVLEGWLSVKRVVLMTATLEDEDRLAHRFPSDQSVNLKRAGLRRDALEDGTLWGPCLAAAKDVGDAMDTAHFTMTPLQARLAVGLVALGEAPETLIAELKHVNSSSTLRPLVDRLRAVLQEHRPALWTGLQAVAQARFPLPVEQVLDLASGHENDRVLLTQCIGYGTEMVRLAEPVRDVLLEHASAGEESHRKLARYYQGRDGATSPLQLTDAPLFAWLEKAHHLAHVLSEPGRDQRWEDLDCPSKHLLWDRARSLSRHFCRYSEAAELYRKSVELYGDDDYAWHYLAFNLHRSGEGLTEAASAYRKAVQPTWRNDSPNVGAANPWWNARLVTFLIAHGKTTDALNAWGIALDTIDPDRKRVGQNAWLALHLHRWVVRAWIEAGEVRHARTVFAEIPEAIVQGDERLGLLRWRLEDAEEAVELLESVYPASTPPSARWQRPQVSPGEELKSWSPGRVVSANKNGVVLMLAAVRDGKPEKRILRSEVTAKEWRSLGGWCPPVEASGFVELHVAGSGRRRILPVTAALPPWALDGEDAAA